METDVVNIQQVCDAEMGSGPSDSEEEGDEDEIEEEEWSSFRGGDSDESMSDGSDEEESGDEGSCYSEGSDESESEDSEQSNEGSEPKTKKKKQIDESDEQWFISRDNCEVWCSQPVQNREGRRKCGKKPDEAEGPTVWARLCVTTIVDSFLLFFRQQLIEDLCKWTNKEGKHIFKDKWRDMDLTEAKKYIGLIILIGVCKSKGEALVHLFGTDTGRPIISKILPRNRFKEITRAMRFEDARARKKSPKGDKLAPVREFFDTWNGYLREAYFPSPAMTVDEQLVTFKGNCPIRRYMPMTPSKYGVKFWMLCDAKTSYVWKVQINLGKQSEDINQGERVVKDLAGEIFYSRRNITGGSFFTSLTLARYLYEKKLTLVGPIQKNQGCLPYKFINTKGRKVASSIFGFQDNCTLVSYCPKKFEVVTMLSTLHETAAVSSTTKRPEIIEYYNETKLGVDRADQMIRNFSCRLKTRRWPMVVFSNLVDISALNAFIIYTCLYPETLGTKSLGRRQFLISLGKELAGIKPNKEEVPVTTVKLGAKKRCYVCPSSINRKTKTFCSECLKNICKEHSVVICNSCKQVFE